MDQAPGKAPATPHGDVNARMEDLIHRIEELRGAHAPASAQAGAIFKSPRPVLGMRCPRCNKRALRKAKRETFVDRMATLILFRPYRCRYCRYFEMRFMLEDLMDAGRSASKRKVKGA